MGMGGFLLHKKANTPIIKVEKSISSQADIIVHLPVFSSSYKQIKRFSFLNKFRRTYVSDCLRSIDSIGNRFLSSEDLPEALDKCTVYASFYNNSTYEGQCIIHIGIPSPLFQYTFASSLKKAFPHAQKFTPGIDNLQQDSNLSYYYYYNQGVYNISISKKLLNQNFLSTNNGEHIEANKPFLAAKNTVSQNAHANIFINLQNFKAENLSDLADTNTIRPILQAINGAWLGADLTLKKAKSLLNGYIIPLTDTIKMHPLAKQTIYYKNIHKLPETTVFFINLPTGNKVNITHSIITDTSSIDHFTNEEKDTITQNSNPLSLDVKELTNARFFDPFNIDSLYSIYILRTSILDSSTINEITKLKDNFRYRGYDYYFTPGNVLQIAPYETLGKSPYYIIDHNRIIFSSNKQAIIAYINSLCIGRTLLSRKDLISFNSTLVDQGSIMIYSNIPHHLNSTFNNKNSVPASNNNQTTIHTSQTIQLSNEKGLTYVSSVTDFAPESPLPELMLWKYTCDAPILNNFSWASADTLRLIIITDSLNQLYALNHKGMLQWKIQLDTCLLSDIKNITVANKSYLVFNTTKSLYQIDYSGEFRPDFPIQLTHYATNGISLAHYTAEDKYRLYLADTNNRIQCFNLNGEIIKGWKQPQLSARINTPITYLHKFKNDYLLALTAQGKIHIMNHLGNKRSNFNNIEQLLPISQILPDTLSNNLLFHSWDNHINHIQVSKDGSIAKSPLYAFKQSPYILIDDLDNDRINDYILCDHKAILFLDHSKTVRLVLGANGNTFDHPYVYHQPHQAAIIAIKSMPENEYSFYSNYNLTETHTTISGDYISIGYFTNSQNPIIVTSNNNQLQASLFCTTHERNAQQFSD